MTTLHELEKLTDEELKRICAELCGTANRWVIMKRGLYYRPGAHGYTSNIQDAWIVSEEEADKRVYPHDEPVTKHRAPSPNYPQDLNACREFEATLSELDKRKYMDCLMAACGIVEDIYEAITAYELQPLIFATPRQRTIAYVLTKSK